MWMSTCGGDDTFKMLKDTDIINSGSIGGSSTKYSKFVDYMIGTVLWGKCILLGVFHDKPVVAILLNGGNLTNIVKYRIVGL